MITKKFKNLRQRRISLGLKISKIKSNLKFKFLKHLNLLCEFVICHLNLKSKINISKPRYLSTGLLALLVIGLLTAAIGLSLRALTTHAAVSWWDAGGNYGYRQQLNIVNSSSVTLSANTTVAISVDTKSLSSTGKMRPDCADIVIVYQPDSYNSTNLPRLLVYPGGVGCTGSTATHINFALQAAIAAGASDTNYYLYYGYSGATAPTTDATAYNMSSTATLVCPFDGTTTCATATGTTSPSSALVARYNGGKSALSFNGVNNDVEVTSTGFNPTSVQTIEFWINLDGTSGLRSIIDRGAQSTQGFWWLYVDNTTNVLKYQYEISGSYISVTGPAITPNTWHHVAVIHTLGVGVDFYLDGVLTHVASTGTYDGSSASHTVYIGSYISSLYLLSGKLDELRISNIARYTANFTPQSGPFVRDSNTLLLYHFDEGSGTTAYDDSTSPHNGTITGATYADTSNINSQSFANHAGIYVEEGTTNKITNPSFENKLAYDTNWFVTQASTLDDQFTSPLPTGQVNGSAAAPTGGTRTVTDTGGKISIASNKLVYASGGTSSNLSYANLTRGAGKMMISEVTPADTYGGFNVLGNYSTGFYGSDNGLYVLSGISVGAFTLGTSYKVAEIMRATGMYYYAKGGTQYPNWTLVYIGSTGSGDLTPIYGMGGNSHAYTSSFIRIPTSTWLPTPLAYDSFTTDTGFTATETLGPDGASGPAVPSLAWTQGTGSTWTVSGGTVSNTPSTTGGELTTNGDFSSWSGGYPTWWNHEVTVNDTITQVGNGQLNGGAGTGALNLYRVDNALANNINKDILTIGGWYQFGVSVDTYGSGSLGLNNINAADFNSAGSKLKTFKATSATLKLSTSSTSTNITVDNVSTQALSLSSLFATVPSGKTDVIANADITSTWGAATGQAGIATNLDSATTPTAGIVAYLTRTNATTGANVTLDKFTAATTWTNLIAATTVTYSAGATLRVVTYHSDANTLKVRVYYNNALVGSEQTVTDAGIISNTIHGLFSTYSGNTFDNFTLWARGSDNEYSSLALLANPADYLTATVNTNPVYTKFGTNSVKLVDVTTPEQYATPVTAGDTNTHSLSVYVYNGTAGTIGGTVDSTVAKLVFNGATVTPTYTNTGGGWYRLTYSAAALATSTTYGVEVETGQTIYIDGVQLEELSYATSYADGSLGTNYGWTGSINGSASTRVTGSVNKLVNGTFDTTLAGWSGAQAFSLDDEFITARPAGAVNLTQAEPTGGTRTVVDTQNQLSISSRVANFGGNTNNNYGDPGIWYPAVTRAAGKMLTGQLTTSSTSQRTEFGFDTDTSGLNWNGASFYWDGNSYLWTYSGNNGVQLEHPAAGLYSYSVVLRTSGVYYFIKGGTYTNWTLFWVDDRGSTSTLYPSIGSFKGTSFTANNIRIPTSTWLPTPLAYSQFGTPGATSTETTGPDGQTTPALAITNGTVSGGTLSITPTTVTDLVTNGNMELDSNWADIQSPTSNTQSNEQAHGGTYSRKIVGNASSESGADQQITRVKDTWYSGEAYIYETVGGYAYIYTAGLLGMPLISPSPSWQHWIATNRATINQTNRLDTMVGSGSTAYFDDVSIKSLALPSLFATVPTGKTDVIADANITMTAPTQAGIVTNLDSASAPTAGLVAYLTAGNNSTNTVNLDKFTATNTWTNIQSTPVTYVPGATLRVVTYTTQTPQTLHIRVYYNNTLVGSEQTVTDSQIVNNTIHGLFSTYSGNTFDNFTLFARGSGGEYNVSPLETLTATQDTATKYDGTASVKLVSPGSADENYLQSINVGDATPYLFTAYAYTTGAAVTSADLQLYYDSAAITTTYTAATNGWYKLSATVTGAASAKNYGVDVKAGKTVYLDDISVNKIGALDYPATAANISATAGTLSFWIKPTWAGNDSVVHELVNADTSAGTFRLYKDSDNSLKLTDGTNTASIAVSWTANTWQHIAADWGSSNMHVYVNNVAGSPSGGYTAPTINTSGSIFIGMDVTKTSQGDGVFSDFRIWNGILTSGDITQIYNAGFTSRQQTSTTYPMDKFDSTAKGQNPVAIYHFDEGYGTVAHDSSPYGNNLTISGATFSQGQALQGNGQQGLALKFDGSSSYLSAAYRASSQFDFDVNPFTIAGSFNHPSTASGTQTILARQSGSTGYKVYMNSSGYICFSVNSDSTCTTVSYADSKWHSFEAVRDTTILYLYIDGVLMAQTTGLTAATVNGNNTIYLGVDSNGSSNYWNGFLDEFYIHPYARSATQIKTDFDRRSALTSAYSLFPNALSSGLVGYWKMDEATWSGTLADVIDSSGNGNTGTAGGATGGAAYPAAGKFGNGGYFDGVDDYVIYPKNLLINKSTLTVSSWFKTSAANGGIIDEYENSSSYSYKLVIASNKLSGCIGTVDQDPTCTSTVTQITSSGNVNDNLWHLATLTYNGTLVTLFLDGQIAGTYAKTGTFQSNFTSYSFIGLLGFYTGGQVYAQSPAKYLAGTIDEARLYNRALSPAEVRQLYDYAPGPVAYWNFDEGSGGTVNDISGNSNTGTWYGTTPYWTAGKYGKAGGFDGNSDYVDISGASLASVITSTGTYTLESWFKINNTASKPIINWSNSGTDRNGFGISSGRLTASYYNGSYTHVSGAVLSTGTWYHATFVNSGGVISLYLNGVLVSDTGYTLQLDSPDKKLGDNTSLGYFNGSIDDVKIYNYARTQKQILQDMSARGGSAVGGLDSYVFWRFDEGQGTVANNQGNGGLALNGTITNGTWNMNGKVNKALTFASNTTVSTTIVDPGYSQSVSFWINPTTTIASKTIVTNLTTNSSSQPIYSNCTGTALALNTWTHIVAESDGSGICRIYQNGILTATGTTGVTYGTALTIGNSFTGTLDEFKFYNYPLSVDEVKVEYNGGAGMKVGASNSDSVYIAYDTFSTAGSGYTEKSAPNGLGLSALPWSGSTWTVSGGTVSNTPATSADILAGWNFTSGWLATNGTILSTNTFLTSTTGGVYKSYTSTDAWYLVNYTRTTNSGTLEFYNNQGAGATNPIVIGSDTLGTFRAVNGYIYARNTVATTLATVTQMQAQPLTLSTLFRTVNTSTPNVTADVNITWTADTQAGLVLNLDSTTVPANFILVYLSYGDYGSFKVKVDEAVGGTYTNKQTTAVTYSAGADLKAVKNGTQLTVYYNGTIVGSTLTMTANTNTNFGLFSTYSGNTFDNFALQTQAVNYSYCVPGGTDYCANPVGEWNFDEGSGQYAYDTSGNGYTGTLGSTTGADTNDPIWSNGKIGKALQFDHVNDYVDFGTSIDSLLDKTVTIEAWIYPTGDYSGSTGTRGLILGTAYWANNEFVFQIQQAASTGQFVIIWGDGLIWSTSVYSTPNTWQHVTLVYDGTRASNNFDFYLNGVYKGSGGSYQNSLAKNATHSLRTGYTVSGASNPFGGKIDQIKVYNYARTASQVAWDYNKGLPLAWWPFDESSGSVANDRSGNFATGTITAANFVPGRINNALSFNGTTSFVSATVSKSINSVSFWMQQRDTSNKSILNLDGGTHTISVTSNAITPSVGWSSPTVYVDGKQTSVLSDTAWHLISVTSATAFSATSVTIGKVSTAFFPGMLDDVRLYGYPLTSAQVKVLYNDSAAVSFRAPTAIAYLLNDQFTTARAAGAVNGTYAEPTGGVRTVVDTSNRLSISSGVLNGATGTSYAGLWYPSMTRTAGRIFTGTVARTGYNYNYFGFDTNTSGSPAANALYFYSNTFRPYDSDSLGADIGTIAVSGTYTPAIVLRSTGAYYFVKGGAFTNWTLLWSSTTNNSGPLYPMVSLSDNSTLANHDNIRIPTSTWLPTPLAYDTFGSAGSTVTEKTGPDSQTTPQVNWTGGTKAGGVMSITPTIGSNVVVNGTFDTDSNWNKGAGWVISGGVATGTAATNNMTQTGDLTTNAWYQMNVDIQSGYFGFWKGTSASTWDINGAGSYLRTGRMAGTDVGVWPFNTGSIDNLSYKPLTLSTLFASVPVGTSNVVADVTIPAYTLGTQAGLVIGLDSASSPNNFLIAYLDGTGKATVDQNLGGTYTNIVTAATATWGATYVLRVIKDGTAVRLYYNNVLINTGTCSASITGTLAGVFSTYSGNTFDNFTVFPRGTGNEFNALNNY